MLEFSRAKAALWLLDQIQVGELGFLTSGEDTSRSPCALDKDALLITRDRILIEHAATAGVRWMTPTAYLES